MYGKTENNREKSPQFFFDAIEQLADSSKVVKPKPNVNKWDGEDIEDDVKVNICRNLLRRILLAMQIFDAMLMT